MAQGGSYTLNTIDRPAVMVFEQNQREEVRDLGGVSSAIKAEPGTHNQTYLAGFKAGQSKDGGIGYAEEQSPTLSATPSALEPTVICAGFVGNQGSKAHGIAYELEKSPTLKAGGGWTALPDTVGALCARDCKGVGNQYADEGKLIIKNISPE